MPKFSQELFDTICERIADGESLSAICESKDMPATGASAIYALCDPSSGEPRYLGKANNPEKRLATHLRDMHRRDYPVYRWMRKLADRHEVPELVVIGWFEDWKDAERRMIGVSRARGWRLLNVAAGGDEPHCPDSVRSENGKKLCEGLRKRPDLMRLRFLKARLVVAARDGYLSRDTLGKVLVSGEMYPSLLGAWSRKVERVWQQPGRAN